MYILYFTPHRQATRQWRALLCAALPGLRFEAAHAPEDLNTVRLASVEVLLAYRPPPGLAARCGALRAIFSLAAGVDHLLEDPNLPDVPIAKMRDPRAQRMLCEYVLTAVLRHHRRFDMHEAETRCGQWRHQVPVLAEQQQVGILGAGEFALAAAIMLSQVGFQVTVWSRTPRTLDGIASLTGRDGLDRLLAQSDVVVCMLPSTPQTRGLLDGDTIASIKRGACLVNVGRGNQVDSAALLDALHTGHLRGATLDVFCEEPLPADAPLWRCPQLLITPHVGSFGTPATAAPHVIANLKRLAADQPLLGLIARERGY